MHEARRANVGLAGARAGSLNQSVVNHAGRACGLAPKPMSQSTEQNPSPVADAPLMGAALSDQSDPVDQPAAPAAQAKPAGAARPSFVFLGVVSGVSLALDLLTKWWAVTALEKTLPSGRTIATPVQLTEWLTFVLARNKGGAWGLLQSADETIRRPFFVLVSLLAIAFIVYLYRRVHPQQVALKWGLPLVLGGAIGNLFDRIRYGSVVDFIDYQATWVAWLNRAIARVAPSHHITDHWPTFNVADIAICIGVGLMAIDMFTSRRHSAQSS